MADKENLEPGIFCRFASIIPAVIIVGATLILFYSTRPAGYIQTAGKVTGELLSGMKDLNPVQIKNGVASLNVKAFVKALNEVDQRKSMRAVADLVYLGQANKVFLFLSEAEQKLYREFLRKHDMVEQDMTVYATTHLAQYIDMAEAIGKTFDHKAIEVALYDARNPVKSVIAVKNSITGIRVDDPANEDLVQLFEGLATAALNSKKLVVQKITTKDGRILKSTKIPVCDLEYGLTAVISINIDTSQLDPELYPEEAAGLLQAIGATSPNVVSTMR